MELNEHLPLVLLEDEHLLAVNKPAGWNTHSPSPYAGPGIYEWLRDREPRWASLSILHRLDKETSGVLVFGKTPEANRSLTAQFTRREIHKEYVLHTDRPVRKELFTIRSTLVRLGDKYVSRPGAGEEAITDFAVLGRENGITRLRAEPRTGRTHQIRVHAAENGFPLLGDRLYGGTAHSRLCLHAHELRFTHPVSDAEMRVVAQPDFDATASLALRRALLDPGLTDSCRWIHGAADGSPDLYLDHLNGFLLAQTRGTLTDACRRRLDDLVAHANSGSGLQVKGIYHKSLTREVGRQTPQENSPLLVWGEPAGDPLVIRENGVKFALRFDQGYSCGLFLDQRDNRRRFATNHVATGFPLLKDPTQAEVLNTFAYTCGFSVCAAMAGARATSIDLSKKYLEWGRENFRLNGLDPAAHDFIYGDVFEWLRRLHGKGRRFDAVVLDPPTFSRVKKGGTFQAGKDYGRLMSAAVPMLKPGGVLLACANTAGLEPEAYLAILDQSVRAAGRRVGQRYYAPQPPDFPITRDEPGYLKTVWLRLD